MIGPDLNALRKEALAGSFLAAFRLERIVAKSSTRCPCGSKICREWDKHAYEKLDRAFNQGSYSLPVNRSPLAMAVKNAFRDRGVK